MATADSINDNGHTVTAPQFGRRKRSCNPAALELEIALQDISALGALLLRAGDDVDVDTLAQVGALIARKADEAIALTRPQGGSHGYDSF